MASLVPAAVRAIAARQQTGTADKRRLDEHVRGLTILSVTVALSMLLLGGLMLRDARRDAWNQATLAANNLSIVMERDIARNISGYDLSIMGAINALQIPDIAQASPALRRAAVFDKATSGSSPAR